MLAKDDEPVVPPAKPEAIKSITVPKYRIKGNVVEYVVNCQNEKSMWQVFRRYQAFKKLHSDLSGLCTFGNPNHCKQGVLPVLCGSHLFEATNQSPELVEQRRRYLEIYLQQLLVPSNNFYPEVEALKTFLLEDMMPVYFRSKTTKLVPGLSMCMDHEMATQWSLDEEEDSSVDEHLLRQAVPVSPSKPPQIVAFTPSEDAPASAVHPSIPDLTSDVGSKTHGALDMSPEPSSFRNETFGNDRQLREQCTACHTISVVDYPKEEWQDTGYCQVCKGVAQHRLLEAPDGDSIRHSNGLGPRPVELETPATSDGSPPMSPNRPDGAAAEEASQATAAAVPEAPAEAVVEVPPRDLGGASIGDFNLVTTLGRGTFGKVMKVIHKPTGRVMAMKVLTKSVVAQRRMVEYIREERDIMAMLPPHPFVVTMHYALQTDHHLYFLLDYLPGGELYSHIHPKSHVSEDVARFYICEVILAIEHIHKHDVCHRDLKPENVVIARDGHIALADFGLARSRFSRVRRKSFVGSAEYLSPETVKNDYQTKALDWWSVGVMLYEMLVGKTPFHGATNTEVYHNVVHKPLDLSGKRGLTPDSTHLISRFLDRNPATRLSKPEDIKKHPFFKNVDWDAYMNKAVTPPFIPDLECNDTKYFAREFTSEWASVQKSSATDPATLKQWRDKFDNFAVSKEVPRNAPAAAARPASLLREPVLIEPQRFIGAWRLLRLELQSKRGQVTYPWGAEVAGLLIYTTAGYFSMQLAPIKRVKIKRHSTEDMAQAFVGFVSQFGSYHIKAGWNFVVHAPTAALNPNMSLTRQKRYFTFTATEKTDTLSLTTDEFVAEDQERLEVRTVTVWERVPPRPGFLRTETQ